eukprot:7094849-Pyramimonas_sp.AAC.1
MLRCPRRAAANKVNCFLRRSAAPPLSTASVLSAGCIHPWAHQVTGDAPRLCCGLAAVRDVAPPAASA